MKEFFVIYHAPVEWMEESKNHAPEEMNKEMELWMNWAKNCGEKLVNFGSPLMGGTKLSPGGNSSASTKEVVGYSILKAEDMEEAKSLLVGHPHLNWSAGCEIEIHEAMPPPGNS